MKFISHRNGRIFTWIILVLVFVFGQFGCSKKLESSWLEDDFDAQPQYADPTPSTFPTGVDDSDSQSKSTVDSESGRTIEISTDSQTAQSIEFDTATGLSTDIAADTGSETTTDTGDSSSVLDSDSHTETGSEIGADIAFDTESYIDTAFFADTDSDVPWRFFTIADIQDGPMVGAGNIRSMYTVDPGAVAVFEIGDLTHNAQLSQWEAHHQALRQGAIDAGAPADHYRIAIEPRFFGDFTRYVATTGNHDVLSADWYSLWNNFLPAQSQLGDNSASGIYFAVPYKNALFILLDSQHFSDAQTAWLEHLLQSPVGQSATWKIAMFHQPVYPCDIKSPLSNSLPWVSLFETYGVDMVIHGHAHTFERTCPMKNGHCVTDGERGVVYLTASGGGTFYLRTVNLTKTGTLSYGERVDNYSCEEILEDYHSYWSHFCHFTVDACSLDMACYDYDFWDGGALQHEYRLNKCN